MLSTWGLLRFSLGEHVISALPLMDDIKHTHKYTIGTSLLTINQSIIFFFSTLSLHCYVTKSQQKDMSVTAVITD